MAGDSLKQRTAGSIKWNLIDKLGSQILYAVTGIVLARVLSQEAFGLVGAVVVFQSFAAMFIDSGFSSALIQRKDPTRDDYSTVFWFNLMMAVGLYIILWFCAPLIARLFQDDQRIIPLARVMFLSFIINATAIVQANRFVKQMNVRPVAIANNLGLAAGCVVGIGMALAGCGAWAIVGELLTMGVVKSAWLWGVGRWVPAARFSLRILKSFFRVGAGVMTTSFLNTVFQNIYSFFVGNRVGLVPLGYFSQADKWSRMGIMSLSQVLTSSFLPTLSEAQDDPERFAAMTRKMNRLTAYILFPMVGFLGVMATAIFHALFGTKWDPAVALFQILLFRGIFTVLTQLYNNYILALGRSMMLVVVETVRDGVALAAIFITLPYIALTSPANIMEGVEIFIWGQVVASVVAWIVTLALTVRLTQRPWWGYLTDLLPYAMMTLLLGGVMWWMADLSTNPWVVIAIETAVGVGGYVALNALLGSRIQADAFNYLRGRRLA